MFDFPVIGIALAPATQGLSVLRHPRVIPISFSLRRVVEGFLHVLPGIASVFVLMATIFYIASVMATQFYGDPWPCALVPSQARP